MRRRFSPVERMTLAMRKTSLRLTFHMGNWILDWHPWEGLNFYAGRKATGACREMIPFEFE